MGVGRRLMDAVVAMNVLKQWVHLFFHQDPDDLVVTVIRCPVHGSGATGLRRIGHWLEVVLLFFVVVGGVLSLLLLFVFQVRLVLN